MNLPGYDVGAFFAAPGVSDFFRGGDQDPLPRNLGAFGDHVTAIHLLSGIGLALFHKQRTGKGQLVDACLFRAAIFSAANWANVAHPDIKSLPGQHNLNGMKNERSESAAVALMSYQTSDGEWIQLLGLDHAVHVPRIAAATGLPDDTWERMRSRTIRAPNDPRAKTDTADLLLRNFACVFCAGEDPLTGQDVVAMLDEIFATKTKDEWVSTFQEHDVWHTVVAKVDDICARPCY